MLELLASDYRPHIQDALAFSVCLAAFVWGAGPERAIAVTWLAMFEFAPRVYKALWGGSFQLGQIDVFLASTDSLAGVIWLAIALNANRNYPLFIAAMQVLVLSGHLARGLIESIAPIAYATMMVAPGWLQLVILAIGLIRHIRRRNRHGAYRDWRVPVKWYGLLADRSGEVRL
jgi:hypothetical protein